jgi:hypothetical protein
LRLPFFTAFFDIQYCDFIEPNRWIMDKFQKPRGVINRWFSGAYTSDGWLERGMAFAALRTLLIVSAAIQ